MRYRNLTYLYAIMVSVAICCTRDTDPPSGTSDKVVFSTMPVSSITADSAISGGIITSTGGYDVLEKGVCWDTITNPDKTKKYQSAGIGSDNFLVMMKPLMPNKRYYVRAYVKTSSNELYGNVQTFNTPLRAPKIVTAAISSVTSTSLVSGGVILDDGGSGISAKGLCYSTTNPLPNLSGLSIPAGSGNSTFSTTIPGLMANTRYYVRAYASNASFTGYSDTVRQIVTPGPVLPTLSNVSSSSITRNSFLSTASVSSNGGALITQYGYCWSTSPNPTTSNSIVFSNGNISGSYSLTVSGLTASTTYYVRAFAINSAGTGYSPQSVIVTTLAAQPPTVSIVSISSVTRTSANASSTVTNDGGATVTDRGVYYSLTNPPTTASPFIQSGAGLGSFISSISPLVGGTTYYVKAYARNSTGTALSTTTLSFTTLTPVLPTISTNTITTISSTGFSAGGNITSDGGAPITERGLCWSTSTAPTIANSRTIDGTGIGSFTSSATAVSNTTYYLRAYARNSVGVAYGTPQYTVLTLLSPPTLVSPATGLTLGCCYPNFSWGAVAGATGYDIQWCRNSAFTGTTYTLGLCGGATTLNLSFLNTMSSTSTTVCINSGSSANNGTWYWRVRAKSALNVGEWSVIRNFNYVW